MTSFRTNLTVAYWIVTAALCAVAIAVLLIYTPTEQSMGPIQKVFYLHLPVAICTFLACLVSFVAGVAYLMKRIAWLDDLGHAGAHTAVILCAVVLMTGMIWARGAWGLWWTWSPRLTFSLALFLLYMVYLMIRSSIESSQRRAIVSAVYSIIAFLDVPLVYLSTQLMPDMHPKSIELAPAMQLTLLVWFVPVLLLSAGLIAGRYVLNNRVRELSASLKDATVTAPPARIHWAGGAT